MKKLTFIALGAFALAATSCKKDRTCTCTVTDSSGSTTHTVVVKNATKKSIKSGACYSGTLSFNVGGSSFASNQSCTIK
ncbi:MAG: hypothetical protein ACXVPN_13190 [Bacteroidia bacterium]